MAYTAATPSRPPSPLRSYYTTIHLIYFISSDSLSLSLSTAAFLLLVWRLDLIGSLLHVEPQTHKNIYICIYIDRELNPPPGFNVRTTIWVDWIFWLLSIFWEAEIDWGI